MRGTNDSKGVFGVGRVTRFYLPLLLQAFSQSLTYPLVAGIVTHGSGGVNSLTAFSQGQLVMFIIGALGGGLITTGLVFAKTWYGYVSFRRLNALMMGALLAMQALAAVPPMSDWFFVGLFALPPDLAESARATLLWSLVMNAAFFLRNVPMVVLFLNYDSEKANRATLVRIGVTLACAATFPKLGWTGPAWGLFALTFGVVIECALTWIWARPYVKALRGVREIVPGREDPAAGEIVALTIEQFRFTLPLSLGGFLLMLSPLVIAAFVGRSADAADMLAIHYVTIGVANPVAFAALRMQTVAIQFPPEYPRDRRLLVYAVTAGAVLGILPFLFSTPFVGDWYFGSYQNVPPRILDTARTAIGAYSFICIIQAVRGRVEGLVALTRHSSPIMASQVAYTTTLLAALSVMMPLGVPGWKMAVISITVAPVAAAAVLYVGLSKVRSQ